MSTWLARRSTSTVAFLDLLGGDAHLLEFVLHAVELLVDDLGVGADGRIGFGPGDRVVVRRAVLGLLHLVGELLLDRRPVRGVDESQQQFAAGLAHAGAEFEVLGGRRHPDRLARLGEFAVRHELLDLGGELVDDEQDVRLAHLGRLGRGELVDPGVERAGAELQERLRAGRAVLLRGRLGKRRQQRLHFAVELADDALGGLLGAVVAHEQLAVFLQPLLVRLEVRREPGDLLALRGRDGVRRDVGHVHDLLRLAHEFAGRGENGLHVGFLHADLDELRLHRLELLVQFQRVRAHVLVRLQPGDGLVELLLRREGGDLLHDFLLDHGPVGRVDENAHLLNRELPQLGVDFGVAGGGRAPQGLAREIVLAARDALLHERGHARRHGLHVGGNDARLVQLVHEGGNGAVDLGDSSLLVAIQVSGRLFVLSLRQEAVHGCGKGLLGHGHPGGIDDLLLVPEGLRLRERLDRGNIVLRRFRTEQALDFSLGQRRRSGAQLPRA